MYVALIKYNEYAEPKPKSLAVEPEDMVGM
jgi:hypothetical protein